MPEKSRDPFQFWEELKRRRVIRVITVYAAAAFVLLELVDIISEPFGLPDWTLKLVTVLLAIGFIISVILSWIYDVTPEGIEKTKSSKEVANAEESPASKGWKIATFVSVVIIVVFVVFYIIGNIKRSSDISKLEKSIAVLPFENWSVGEENSHLGRAIANEIITELCKIQEFHVISYTSSSQYKPGNKPPISQIRRELGVNFIIEGSIERQGDTVNIHFKIILANTDDHLTAREFDGMWEDIHSIQDDIALTVANELKTILSPEEIEQIEKRPTDNPEAYKYYLRGNDFFLRSHTKRDWSIAIRNYEKAIKLDPDFALAYIKIAISHISWYWLGHDGYKLDRIDKCKKAIDVAFNLDPNIPEGYMALGLYYYWGFLDYPEALKQFDLALRYMPNNSYCLFYKGSVYRRMGDYRVASEMMKEALSYDPKNHIFANILAGTYDWLCEYPEALKYYDLAINLNPEFASTYVRKARLFLKWEGNTFRARKVLEDEADLAINLLDYPYFVVNALNLDIYDGHLNGALDLLNTSKVETFYQQDYYYPKSLLYAKIYDIMGDSEQADRHYDQARTFLEDKILENPNDPRYYSSLGICFAGLGYKNEALEAVGKGIELWPINKDILKGTIMLEELAHIYTMVEEYDLALEQLDYLLSNPSSLSANLLQLDPKWKPLWDKPEFTKLIEKYSEK